MVAAFDRFYNRANPISYFGGCAEIFHIKIEQEIRVESQMIFRDKRRMHDKTAAIERLDLDWGFYFYRWIPFSPPPPLFVSVILP